MLPQRCKTELARQLQWRAALHEQDLREGFGAVELPYAFAAKAPSAAKSLEWQFVFASQRRCRDPRGHEIRRHHRHESGVGSNAGACARTTRVIPGRPLSAQVRRKG